MGVMLVAIVAMLWTTLAGFRGIAVSRRRQVATALANQAIEQVRALKFETVQLGLGNSDLSSTTDVNITKTGSGSSAVYSYGAEQIPHGDNANVTPLVPHQQSVVKNNITYTVSSYLTYYQNNQTSNTYRLTVIVTWRPLNGETGREQAQTILYAPNGGSTCANSTHPFPGTCQAFFYGSASSQPGQLYITGPISGIPLDHGALWLPSRSSSTQIEQIQAVQGSAQTAGMTLQLQGQDEQSVGRQQATSGADTDPAQPKPTYQTASTPAQASGTLQASGNGNTLTGTMAAGDTASTTSTVTARTADHPCPLLVPSSSYDLTQDDNQPCGSSKTQQGGTMTGVLATQAGPNSVTTTLATVAAATTPGTSFTNRDLAPEATVCKLTSGDGCIESQATRSLGTVTLIQLPIGTLLPITDLPGYDTSKGLVQMTGYVASASAEAGVGAGAPVAAIPSGTILYYNGSGYTTLVPTLTPAPIPVGGGGNGVHLTDPLVSPLLQIDVTTHLSTGGGSVSDPAAGCSSPCTRTQASATVNSPIIGYVTYTVTYAGTVLADVTMAVDLGTTLAKGSYQAAPSA